MACGSWPFDLGLWACDPVITCLKWVHGRNRLRKWLKNKSTKPLHLPSRPYPMHSARRATHLLSWSVVAGTFRWGLCIPATLCRCFRWGANPCQRQ
jgi:hypothetical protein